MENKGTQTQEESLVERARGYITRGIQADSGDYTFWDLVNYVKPIAKAAFVPFCSMDNAQRKVGVPEESILEGPADSLVESVKAIQYTVLGIYLFNKFGNDIQNYGKSLLDYLNF